MDVIVERCAGLDVHRDSVVATLRVPGTGKSRRRRAQQTRTFGTTIAQLEQLGDWLEGFAVTLVGMEATGVYWKPVFSVLERRFECWLINAEHLHNVPGRKSDVIDSRWLCELLGACAFFCVSVVVRCCRGCGLRSGCGGRPLRLSSCNRCASWTWRVGLRARSV